MRGPSLEIINIQPKKGGPPLKFINQRGGPPLGFINQMGVRLQVSATRWGSASRFHQHTALQKGVRLQNSSTYSPQKGARLQNSSTYSPPKGVRLQNSSTKGVPHLDFINQKGIPSTKKGVRLQGQFLWIQQYICNLICFEFAILLAGQIQSLSRRRISQIWFIN